MNQPIDERIGSAKAMAVLAMLQPMTKGPRECYGTLMLAVWLLNFKISDDPVSIDRLCDEVVHSLKSIKEAPAQ